MEEQNKNTALVKVDKGALVRVGKCLEITKRIFNINNKPDNDNIDYEYHEYFLDEWMVKNLNVNRFQNGDFIPEAKTNEEWIEAGENCKPAWCYYDNNPENGEIYGKLYNWYAVNDKRGLAPKGWNIPSDSNWRIMIKPDKENLLDRKIEEASSLHLNTQNTEFYLNDGYWNNPGGLRDHNGDFYGIEGFTPYGYWWSSTLRDATSAWCRGFDLANIRIVRFGSVSKKCGLSVLCIRHNKKFESSLRNL